MNSQEQRPFVSVVLAARNEVDFIEECIRSLARSNYPSHRLEILVVDGMSTDGTRDVVNRLRSEIPSLRLVDNHEKSTPYAFNHGIRAASGEVIAIFNAHSEYDADYLSKCVDTMLRFDADLVGGIVVPLPRSTGPIGRAVARAMRHPFGIGNSKFRTGADRPIEVDAAGFGLYHKRVFENAGLFDLRLKRSQDLELNNRIKKAGGRIMLEPSAKAHSFVRSRLPEVCRYNFHNGRWVALPIRYAGARFSLRHLVPGLFVLSLLLSGSLAPVWRRARFAFFAIGGAYLGALTLASIDAASRERDSALLMTMPMAFLSIHLPYGVGTLWGLLEPLDDTRERS